MRKREKKNNKQSNKETNKQKKNNKLLFQDNRYALVSTNNKKGCMNLNIFTEHYFHLLKIREFWDKQNGSFILFFIFYFIYFIFGRSHMQEKALERFFLQ